MKNFSKISLGALLLTASCGTWAKAAEAAKERANQGVADIAVLEAVPDDALAIVLINRLDKFDAELSKLAARFGVPVPGGSVLQALKMQASAGEGFDDHGSAAWALLPGKTADDSPSPVTYLPITNYKKFVEQFAAADSSAKVTTITTPGGELVVGHKGKFAIVAPPAYRDGIERAVESKTGLGGSFASLDTWIGQHYVSFIATTKGVKQGAGSVRKQLHSALDSLPKENSQARQVASVFGIYDSILALGEQEVAQFAAGFRASDSGDLFVESRTDFTAGGKLAQFAKDAGQPAGLALPALLKRPYVAAFDGTLPPAWIDGLVKLSMSSTQTAFAPGPEGKPPTEKQIEQISAASRDSLKGVKGMAIEMALPEAGQGLYSAMTGVFKVENSRDFIANYEKSLLATNEVLKGLDSPLLKPTKIEKIEVDGIKALSVTMDLSGALAQAGDPSVGKIIETLFGPGGKVAFYLAAADEKTVVLAYVNKSNLKPAIEQAKKAQGGLDTNADFKITAALMPKKAQWIGYVSPQGVMDLVISIVNDLAPPGAAPPIPAFAHSPPVGLAATITSSNLETTIVLPAAMLDEVGAFIDRSKAAAQAEFRKNFGDGPTP